MSKQTSLTHFFKQDSITPTLLNSSLAFLNDSDSNVNEYEYENESKPLLKKVKLITTYFKYNESFVGYGFTYYMKMI